MRSSYGTRSVPTTLAPPIAYNRRMDNNEKVAELEAMIAQMEQQIKTAEELIEHCKTQIANLREHVARLRALPDNGQK